MAYCTQQIVALAGSIYSGIGAPSAQSVGFVSGWITSSGVLGDINNRLNTDFYLDGSGPCIAGDFGDAEGAILDQMYQSAYYRQRALAALAGADSSSWTSMKEGDTAISREKSSDRSKAYLDMSKDSDQNLYIAINNWKVGHSIPASIDGSDLASFPSP